MIHVERTDDEVIFHCLDGNKFHMYHSQNCCESVYLEDVCGDLADLHGLVTEAYEAESGEVQKLGEYDDCYEWTFYVVSTQKGAVTFRWYGTSNGYYSTSADFGRVN